EDHELGHDLALVAREEGFAAAGRGDLIEFRQGGVPAAGDGTDDALLPALKIARNLQAALQFVAVRRSIAKEQDDLAGGAAKLVLTRGPIKSLIDCFRLIAAAASLDASQIGAHILNASCQR